MNEEIVRELDESIGQPEFNPAPDIRQVVEETAGLLDVASATDHIDGRADQAPPILPEEDLSVNGDSAERQNGREEMVAGILNRLAESAATFIAAVQELARHSTSASRGVRDELDRFQGSVDRLAGVVSELQTSVSASQQQYAQLSAAVASVHEVNERHEAEIGGLREDARERTGAISGRLEDLSARLDSHCVDVSGLRAKVESLVPLHSMVADLSSKVATWCERLDRQEEVLHSLCEMQTQRAAALHQFYEVLTRIETSVVLPSSSKLEESRAAAC